MGFSFQSFHLFIHQSVVLSTSPAHIHLSITFITFRFYSQTILESQIDINIHAFRRWEENFAYSSHFVAKYFTAAFLCTRLPNRLIILVNGEINHCFMLKTGMLIRLVMLVFFFMAEAFELVSKLKHLLKPFIFLVDLLLFTLLWESSTFSEPVPLPGHSHSLCLDLVFNRVTLVHFQTFECNLS